MEATYHSPVDILLFLLAPESDVDIGEERAHDEENDAQEIELEPLRLDLLRVADEGVVESRKAEASRCREQEEGDDGIVPGGHILIPQVQGFQDIEHAEEEEDGGYQV